MKNKMRYFTKENIKVCWCHYHLGDKRNNNTLTNIIKQKIYKHMVKALTFKRVQFSKDNDTHKKVYINLFLNGHMPCSYIFKYILG